MPWLRKNDRIKRVVARQQRAQLAHAGAPQARAQRLEQPACRCRPGAPAGRRRSRIPSRRAASRIPSRALRRSGSRRRAAGQRDQEPALLAAGGDAVAAVHALPVGALFDAGDGRVDGDHLVEVGAAHRAHRDRAGVAGCVRAAPRCVRRAAVAGMREVDKEVRAKSCARSIQYPHSGTRMKFNRSNSSPGLSSRSYNQETSDETNDARDARFRDIQRRHAGASAARCMAMLRAIAGPPCWRPRMADAARSPRSNRHSTRPAAPRPPASRTSRCTTLRCSGPACPPERHQGTPQ